MIEFAFVVSVFVVGAVGYFVGLMIGANRERRKKPEPVKAICPCSHSVGSHQDGGKCLAAVRTDRYSGGSWMGYDYSSCSCTKYYGPVVVTTEFFHPGVVYESD